jgi:hypothetical protein
MFLLASLRVLRTNSHKVPPRKKTAGESELLSPQLLLEKLVELRGIEALTLRLPERKKGDK